MRYLLLGLAVGIMLGSAGHASGVRQYLFSGQELFNDIAYGHRQEAQAYVAGVIDSISFITFGGQEAASNFVKAGRCLHNNPNSVSLIDGRHIEFLLFRGTSGDVAAWEYGAAAPRVVAAHLSRPCG